MKYKKGTKVEVLNKREVPSGSWWCAEIISGNGHTYSVRYDPSPSGMSELVERVPRKVIRPCPPSVQDPITWMSGDIVEVFDNGSWKLAEVCSTVDGNCFSVRVLGSSRLFNADKSDIRLRQCWKDNRWIVIEKDVRSSESAKLLNGRCQKRVSCQGTSGSVRAENCEETTTYEEPKLMSIGGKRRGSQQHPFFHESRGKVIKKMKANGTENKWRHFCAEKPHSIPEKVDAVASPKIMLGETNMHASLNNGMGFSNSEMRGRRPNGDVSRSFTTPIEPENRSASVCSSSGNGGGLLDDADSTSWSKF
ncbi:unnamed protein product [Spirodela intermedia]|uniref:Agenet domain-containing protein n=1 Tax=Spirodela intermedia TaxID=51605 RepID=A0A7I8J8D4_SPIIN|nr:unnamed protein product [Spirodela intermedia]CAA6666359.1 unnamed protein product [Spirodela intermedia]